MNKLSYHALVSRYLNQLIEKDYKIVSGYGGLMVERTNNPLMNDETTDRWYIDQGDTGLLFYTCLDRHGRTMCGFKITEFDQSGEPSKVIPLTVFSKGV